MVIKNPLVWKESSNHETTIERNGTEIYKIFSLHSTTVGSAPLSFKGSLTER